MSGFKSYRPMPAEAMAAFAGGITQTLIPP
jgi:hypothetical protein